MMVAYDRISSSAMEFGKFQTWCQWTYFILLNSGVYLIQFRTIHNSRHFDWGVRQIDESTNGVWETSKLDGTGLISLFPIGVFTLFNSELVTTQDISIGGATNWWIYQWSSGNFKAWCNSTYLNVPNWGVYLIQFWTCHNSRHFDWWGATDWRIYQWSSGNFKPWWN